MRLLSAGLILCLCASTAAADTSAPAKIPVEKFFDYPEFANAKISPDGKYLALTTSDDPGGAEDNAIIVFSTDDLKPVMKFPFSNHKSILDYWWANDERVIIATKTLTGSFDVPIGDGELYAVNVDGTKPKALMGREKFGQLNDFTYLKHDTQVFYFLQFVGLVADDPKHVVVRAYIYNAGQGQISHAYLLNIYSGQVDGTVDTPAQDGAIMMDQEGVVRASWGPDPETGKYRIYVKPDPTRNAWTELKGWHDTDTVIAEVQPLGFLPDGKSIYWLGRNPSGTLGLFTLDIATQKEIPVSGDPDYDLDYSPYFRDYGRDGDGAIWSFDYAKDRHIVAVETMPGLPAVQILDSQDPKAGYLAQLYGMFPGQHVRITSNTRDQSKMIVETSSDRDPGEFYLLDTKTNKMALLFKAKSDIDPNAMASMQPIDFKARDGVTLHGYLTTPLGGPAKDLPMILLVHGGPELIRDRWGWDPETQFFANHGYAVLQVNYRGSGGYGSSFQDAGYRHWGTVMQDDLADAVRWAELQGYADPKRVCIYGASYGGYAALENPIRYPDLYRCAVGYVGAYDLTLLGHTGAAANEVYLQKDFDGFLGTDMEQRKQQSPVYNADKLKIPVLIAYGGEDQTVVPEHAKEMLAALDKAGVKHPEPIYQSGEAHGFLNPDNNAALYTRMLAFFDQYIGPDAAKSAAATK